ncbi:MAG: NAD(P)H-hydrate epimerase [Asgard group archaeon]|nr:NAD(P)H-hydrate epimerase [Asgard group archaeon]
MNKNFPCISSKKIPFITVEQMVKVDELMIGKYTISLLQMMENAGLNLAILSRKLYPKEKKIHILIGKGNNGGGGLVAVRRLYNWGYDVKVVLATKEEKLKSVPLRQLKTLKKLDVQILYYSEYSIGEEDLIIDALLGYNLKGNPRGNYANLIKMANESNAPIISLDIPSSIEGTSGLILEPVITADTTMTLALPKTAFQNYHIKKHIGRLFVADISVPYELYKELEINIPHDLFQKSIIIEIKE